MYGIFRRFCLSQTAALRQLTGIKKNVAPVLSAELGDLSTYRRTQLVAAVGLNPIPNESGKYAGRSRLSKGGSKRARAMPHLAARSLFRSKGPSRDHIEWLKRRGLSNHACTLGIRMRKLLLVARAVVRNGGVYAPQKLRSQTQA